MLTACLLIFGFIVAYVLFKFFQIEAHKDDTNKNLFRIGVVILRTFKFIVSETEY